MSAAQLITPVATSASRLISSLDKEWKLSKVQITRTINREGTHWDGIGSAAGFRFFPLFGGGHGTDGLAFAISCVVSFFFPLLFPVLLRDEEAAALSRFLFFKF